MRCIICKIGPNHFRTSYYEDCRDHICVKLAFEPEHEISVLISYAQKLPLIANTYVPSVAGDLNCGLSLHVHPYFMYAGSQGSGETVWVRRPTRALACSPTSATSTKIPCAGLFIYVGTIYFEVRCMFLYINLYLRPYMARVCNEGSRAPVNLTLCWSPL